MYRREKRSHKKNRNQTNIQKTIKLYIINGPIQPTSISIVLIDTDSRVTGLHNIFDSLHDCIWWFDSRWSNSFITGLPYLVYKTIQGNAKKNFFNLNILYFFIAKLPSEETLTLEPSHVMTPSRHFWLTLQEKNKCLVDSLLVPQRGHESFGVMPSSYKWSLVLSFREEQVKQWILSSGEHIWTRPNLPS